MPSGTAGVRWSGEKRRFGPHAVGLMFSIGAKAAHGSYTDVMLVRK